MAQYNLRNPAVKRIMREAEELKDPTTEYYAQPLEDNLFEWHFTLRGPPNSDFEGGIYHGRITLPPDYPMKPPSIILLTPNGRFEVNRKICLSISGHHPESWQPSWSIRTALLAIIGFMPTHGNGAIGSLDYTPEERRQLALKSQSWKCPECGFIKNALVPESGESESSSQVGGGQRSEANLHQNCSPSVACQTDENSYSKGTQTDEIPSTDESEESQSNGDNILSTEKVSTDEVLEQNEDGLFPRRRHLSSPSEEDSADTHEPNRNEVQSRLALIFIWTISIILIILIARRLFF